MGAAVRLAFINGATQFGVTLLDGMSVAISDACRTRMTLHVLFPKSCVLLACLHHVCEVLLDVQVGVQLLFAGELYAWFCVGEVIGRGGSLSGYSI